MNRHNVLLALPLALVLQGSLNAQVLPNPGFYSIADGLGSDVAIGEPDTGHYTTEGSLALFSNGDPCLGVKTHPQSGSVRYAEVTCYDRVTRTFHGLQWPSQPADKLAGGGIGDVRVAMRSDDTPVAAWIDSEGTYLMVSQFNGTVWDDFSGTFYPWEPVNCMGGGCQPVDSFDLVIDADDQPVLVFNNALYGFATHWSEANGRWESYRTPGYPFDLIVYGTNYDQIAHIRVKCGPSSGDPYVIWTGTDTNGAEMPVGLIAWNGTYWMAVGPSMWTTVYSGSHADLDVDIYGRAHVVAQDRVGSTNAWNVVYTRCGAAGCGGLDGGSSDSFGRGQFPTVAVKPWGRPDVAWYRPSLPQFAIMIARWNQAALGWQGLWTTAFTTVMGGETFWRPSIVHDAQYRANIAAGMCLGRSANCNPSEGRFTRERP